MSESQAIQRTVQRDKGPATTPSLAADLGALGVTHGMTLLVHASMSQLGYVVGDAEAVVAALVAAVGPEGTLVMPAMSSGRSEPSHWRAPPVPEPWWPVIREHMPAFDPRTTPSRMIGAVAECFRTWPGVQRSNHPINSFVARGPAAGDILADHALKGGMGERSPLARLYERGAHVLLLGVGHGNNTSLHLAEYRADFPGKTRSAFGTPMFVEGERRWVEFEELELDDSDFPALGEAFAAETDHQVEGEVACARALLFPQASVVDFAVTWMETHRGR